MKDVKTKDSHMWETLIHYFLKFLWVIKVHTDGKGNRSWGFNFLNPVGWALLLAWAIVLGTLEGLSTMVRVVYETCKDSKNL